MSIHSCAICKDITREPSVDATITLFAGENSKEMYGIVSIGGKCYQVKLEASNSDLAYAVNERYIEQSKDNY